MLPAPFVPGGLLEDGFFFHFYLFTYLFFRKYLSSDTFLLVLFTNKISLLKNLLPPGDLFVFFFFLLGEKLMQKVQTDETAFSHTCH